VDETLLLPGATESICRVCLGWQKAGGPYPPLSTQEAILERIAVALEKIAGAVPDNPTFDDMLAAIEKALADHTYVDPDDT
jgi:hypothetical protein